LCSTIHCNPTSIRNLFPVRNKVTAPAKESWVVDQSKRSRTSDPIPVFRLGKHRRYRWGSPELNAWLDRRAGYNTQQREAEPKRKEER